MKLIIASNNEGKIREIKQILGGLFGDIQSLREAGYELDVEENGTTFEQNALIKARAVALATGCTALADDSGLCVDALGGAPGVYSARYCGHHGDDISNNEKLLRELKAVPEPRKAHYACAMALCWPDGRHLVATGECHGQILRDYMGKGGFGYDPLFVPDGFSKTFGEIDPRVKNGMSHRYKALEKLLLALRGSKL